MKNSSVTSLGVIIAAAVLWGSYGLKSQIRGTQKERPVIGEESFSPPIKMNDVAARGPISQKPFDIKNFENVERPIPKSNKSVHRSLREMQRLLKCFESETCNFDQSSAQSYRTALREDLTHEMSNFQQLVVNEKYQNSEVLTRASEVARFFLEFPDDDIKDQAMSLASALPISNETCDALIKGISDSSSAPNYQKALQELLRYKGTTQEARIDKFITENILSGSSFVSKILAKESLPFISSKNAPIYLEVLNQLPKPSQEFEILRANIAESMRM